MNAFTNNYAQNQGYQQGAFPGGFGYQQSYAYGAPMAKPLMTNPLTDEERKLLARQEDLFDLKVTPEELAYAVCTHKRGDSFDVVTDGQGNVTCRTCGATFRPDDVDEKYVQETTDRMMNVMQTLKFIGVDLNSDLIRQYFAMIPYIKRVPKLFKAVNKSFQKYNDLNPAQPVNMNQNVVGMFNSLMNPAVPIGGYYNPYPYGQPVTPFTAQQGQMVNGGQTPFYTQAPQQVPQGQYYGQPVPPMGYAPQPGAPMNQPVAPNAQAAPQQPQVQNAPQQQPAQNDVNVKTAGSAVIRKA